MRSFPALLVACLLATAALMPLSSATADPVPDAGSVLVAPAPTSATTPIAVAAPLPDPGDPVSIVKEIIGAGKAGQWWMLGALICVLLIWVSRMLLGKFIPWFTTDRGGAVLALIIGLLSALAATLASGKPSWAAIADGVKLALVAIGTFVSVKKIVAPSDATT